MSSLYSFYCNSKNCHHRNGNESLSIEELKVLYKDIKLQKCGKCSSSFYCCRECQLYDWEHGSFGGHKRQCQISVDRKNSMYNDPNVTNGSEPGSTYQPNCNFPSRSVEAHEPKRYNPRDGHKVKSLSKSKKTMNSLPQLQQKTFDIMTIMVIKVILSDQWDRIEKSLAPRPDDFVYQFGIDLMTNANDEEILGIWRPQVLQFKSWCYRASSEGRIFEFKNDSAAKLSTINQLLETFIEWEPKSPDYHHPLYASVLATIASGLANQQFYLLKILNPDSSLNKYVDILIRWSNLNDLPSDHFWHTLIELMVNGLLVGVEFSEKFFDPINPSLLVVLKPVFERLVQVLSERRNLEPFQSTGRDELQVEINKFIGWNADMNGGKSLRTIIRALKFICPELDISPIRFLWQWHKEEFDKFITKYPVFQFIPSVSEQIDILNELEIIYLKNN